jgi:hypothetical protein
MTLVDMTSVNYLRTKAGLALALCATLAVVGSGCGGAYDASVSGEVTLDGNPVPRGTVTFSPTQGGPTAYGQIEEDGDYYVQTGTESGLPVGEYQVTVVAEEPPAVTRTAAGGPPPSGKSITPEWYRLKDSSGLKYTVESGSNRIDLKLSSTPPAGWKPGGRR